VIRFAFRGEGGADWICCEVSEAGAVCLSCENGVQGLCLMDILGVLVFDDLCVFGLLVNDSRS
jgi:hypothetical protein